MSAARAGGSDGRAVSENAAVITMWKSGFQVNNGPYRALNDPDNAVFLRTLASGRVPAELAPPSSPGSPSTGPVDVKLEDKRDQEYVPPDYVAFSGGGNSLVAEGGEEVEAVGASE
ncbi:hypothetical protein TrRE_jg12351, partial [Triparma retinervis]